MSRLLTTMDLGAARSRAFGDRGQKMCKECQ